MAITHAAFLTQVRDYTEVSSNVLTDSIIDKFIRATELNVCLLYTSPSPRDRTRSRMPSSA